MYWGPGSIFCAGRQVWIGGISRLGWMGPSGFQKMGTTEAVYFWLRRCTCNKFVQHSHIATIFLVSKASDMMYRYCIGVTIFTLVHFQKWQDWYYHILSTSRLGCYPQYHRIVASPKATGLPRPGTSWKVRRPGAGRCRWDTGGVWFVSAADWVMLPMSDHPSFWKPPLRQGTAGPGKSAAESPDSSIEQSIFGYPLVLSGFGEHKKSVSHGFHMKIFDKIHVNPRSTWTRWARPSGLRCSRPTLKRQKLLTWVIWVAEIHVSHCFPTKSWSCGAASKWLASG